MAHPVLRPELRFTPRGRGSTADVLIEDPLSGAYLETDPDTAAFARLLNGKRTPIQAFARLMRERPRASLALGEVEQVLALLQHHGMLVSGRAGAPIDVKRRRLGPISQRVRLGTGDRFFAICARRLWWLYSPVALVLGLTVVVIGASELVSRWGDFYHRLHFLFSADFIVLGWLAWVVSKAWHELQHGVVARLNGVRVREVGLLFILFVPLGAYVDVTDGWRLDSTWRRMQITFAGIAGELVLGSIAVLLWTRAPDGDWRTFLQLLIMATMVSSIVFNANPLMRYDGYYALTDLLKVPNLYQRGALAVRNATLRVLANAERAPEAPLIVAYGWLALGWRILIASTLTMLAAHLAFGFGLVLALVVIWTMVFAPLGQMARAVWQKGIRARRTAATRLVWAGAALALLWYAPVPTWIRAPAVVEFKDGFKLHAISSGEVISVHMRDGDAVAQGDAVLSLQNAAMLAEYKRLEARRAHAEIGLAAASASDDPSATENKREVLASTEQELAEKARRVAALTLQSPKAGIVYGETLRDLEGAWLRRGDMVGEIAEPGRLRIRAWLLPDDVALLDGRTLRLTFRQVGWGMAAVPVELTRIEPSADVELPPDSLTAQGDGPLAIELGDKKRLQQPRFQSSFDPVADAGALYPGAPGRLTSSVVWRPLNSFVLQWFDHFDLRNPARWALSRS